MVPKFTSIIVPYSVTIVFRNKRPKLQNHSLILMASQHELDTLEPSPFKSLLNFRDIGRTVNRLHGKMQVSRTNNKARLSAREAYKSLSTLREGKLYRSARAGIPIKTACHVPEADQ